MSFLFPNTECFRTIISDCPWAYDNFGQAKHGAARAHYPTMTLEELAAIPVKRWAADDAVLLLWGTWPKLDEAQELVRLWGSSYVTGFPWVKTTPSSGEIRCGIGFWFQSASEPVLLGRWGSLPRSEGAPRVRGLLVGEEMQFYAPTREHSSKPVEIHEYVEQTLPGPYLELFAREERPGWTCWGNELGFELGPWGVRECVPFVPQNAEAGA